jgi:hypothetical protein
MMTKTVRVIYKGKIHFVEVPCEPNHSIERLEKGAIKILQSKEEKEEEKRKKESNQIWQLLKLMVK